jgi:superfamily II DNA or RNA helicase
MEEFRTGKIQVLVSVEALGTGFNMPDIDSGICVAADSTTLGYIQQLGRTVRFKPGKQAKFINIFCKNTVEEGWMEKKLRKQKHKTCQVEELLQIIQKSNNSSKNGRRIKSSH